MAGLDVQGRRTGLLGNELAEVADRQPVSAGGSHSIAESYIDLVQGNVGFMHVLTGGLLHCLDVQSQGRCKLVCQGMRAIIEEGTESDFQLRMGKILYLRNRYNERFAQHLLTVENDFLRRMLTWVVCLFVLMPLCAILYMDFDLVPVWSVPLSAALALIGIFLPDAFSRAPRSGHNVVAGHEQALWRVTANKLFSKSDRRFLKFWAVGATTLPLSVSVSLWLWPSLWGLPYLEMAPISILLLIPMWYRYRQTRQLCVLAKQFIVAVWMIATLMVTWFLVTYGAKALQDNFCLLFCCDPDYILVTLLAAVFWSAFLATTTLAFPMAFSVVNFWKSWYTSAACGACIVCLEITALASLSQHTELAEDDRAWPVWRFAMWPLLAGILGAIRLAWLLLLNRLAGLTDCWVLERSTRPVGAQRFVMPPLLPPTISARAFDPRWRDR